VTVSGLLQAESERVGILAKGRHILALQDTTELNYQAHAGRVHGLGTVGNGKDLGFYVHPLFAFDADTEACLGIAAAEIWNRTEPASEKYQRLKIEEKESYRWVKVAEEGRKALGEAAQITFVGDRENDIYEFFDRIPNDWTHLLTRVRGDRRLTTGVNLYEHLDSLPESGRQEVKIRRDIRQGRSARKAVLAIKYDTIEIKRPDHCTDKGAAKTIKLTVVEAKEMDCPAGQEPVHWRLFTTHRVESLADALQIVHWYRCRWQIEQLFRMLKKKGLDIESSQIEAGENLMKLAVFALCAAVRIMELLTARDGDTDQKTADVFDEEEVEFLAVMNEKVQGKTEKQKNPYNDRKENLAWASWIIARIGCWHGTKSEGKPGPGVFARGFNKFKTLFKGYMIHKNLCAA
jgi:hypothetical protein